MLAGKWIRRRVFSSLLGLHRRKTMRVACIGSRGLSNQELDLCRQMGRLLVRAGYELHSGNAPGADQAFAAGGNEVDPSLVFLHLPWPGFEKQAALQGNQVDTYPFEDMRFYVDIAAENHPYWNRLKSGVRKLHTRNAAILVPGKRNVDVCLAWPSRKPGGGGTGQGMRIAQKRGIRLLDLTRVNPQQVIRWLEDIQ
ncbi:MAG: hypothetical protein GF334_08005 [Candidatus Altiarchaeales archaeon]|nr:hypothetical protein [Candidatus Altiarchaeales archaeon]